MTPVEELRTAAEQMKADADDARAEMTGNPYWGGDVSDAAWASGVDNALGDVAGRVMARWTPGVIKSVADLLDKLAWMGGLDPDLLSHVGCDEALVIARAYLGTKEN
jgi:hypothetical protein